MDTRPIGILDSGVGGLTIWKEILRELPNESTIYIADSKYCPYGDKTPEEIYVLAKRLIRFLLSKKVKLIVIACNTITVTCLDKLRNEFKNVPIIGTVPVVKKAVEITKKKKIGVLSTNNTAKSFYQKHLIEQFADGVEVINKGTNKLVPLVEKGQLDGEKVRNILKEDLKIFKDNNIDILALGCTHFPFFVNSMQEILGKKITILDSGGAIARQVRRVLTNNNMLNKKNSITHILHTTGDRKLFETLIMRFGKKPNTMSRVTIPL